MRKKMLAIIGGILVLVVGLVAAGWAAWYFGRSRAIPDVTETFGPFEVVTHTHRYMTGWNTGKFGTGTEENYSLRYRSRPFSFEGKAGMWGDQVIRYEIFNSIITFPSTPPALVVNAGDPDNASFYYLVREKGGAAVAEFLGASSGSVSAQWLDPPEGKSPSTVDTALHRGRLEGGRWLLLGDYTLLDTRTFKSTALSQPEGFSLNQFKPPLALAPDSGSFVRFGYAMDSTNAPKLAVFELGTGTAYTLPIDRVRMRYHDWPEIDAAWLDHHFEWQAGLNGRLRLLEREDFKPLPYQGSLKVDPNDGYREYKVSPVKPEMRDRLAAFLEARHGAEIQPRGPYDSADVFLVGGHKVHVMFHGESVGVWMDRGADSRLVEEVAAGFDEVLRTGELDGLFVLPAGGG